eukprot:14637510-Alexandrium_andersonii.AAC.1
MQVDTPASSNDYDKLSQVTSWIRQAKDANAPEVAEALARAQETIKHRLNLAKPAHDPLAHFQRREMELSEKLL